MLGVIQHKIQAHQFVFDRGRLTFPPVPVIFFAKRVIERLGAEVIDHAVVAVNANLAMPVGLQFVNQDHVFPTFGPLDKGQKLAAQEVAAVQGGDAQKLRFLGVVSKILKGGDSFGSSHNGPQKEKISVK